MKILVLKPSSLGDVVQALPVLRLLRRCFPQARIDWWIDAHLSGLLEGDRDVSHLVLFERRRWARPRYWHEALRSIRQIRQTRYDWVIDLQALARSGILAWLARGELTIGLEDLREAAAAFYALRVPRPSPATHAVDWYLEVLRRLGVPMDWDFEWMPQRAAVAAQIDQRWPPNGATWIALQPGARWETKRWPVALYSELLGRLAGLDPHLRFVVFGSRDEQALAAAVSAAAPTRSLNLAGEIDLAQMIEWMRRCRLLISNDTGPMHVAAALGIAVVALFGPTDPRRTGPYGQVERVLQSRLPCVPCLQGRCRNPQPLECLRSLSVDRVFAEVRQRLAELT